MAGQESYEFISLIKRLAILLHQNIDLWLKPYDLARTQYAILHHLREQGSLPTKELLAKLRIEPATLSGLIDTLETKGLVVRVEQADDKRRKDVRLTPAGHKLLAEIPPPGPVMERAMLRGIDAEQAGLMKAAGYRMMENLELELRRREKNN